MIETLNLSQPAKNPIDNLSDFAKYIVNDICAHSPIVYYEIGFLPGSDFGALFSFETSHRLALWNIWDYSKELITFVLLNPLSDEWVTPDTVTERCIKRAKLLNAGGVVVVNLFSFITPDVVKLKIQSTPAAEPRNTEIIVKAGELSDKVILAWGGNGSHLSKDKEIIKVLEPYKSKLFILGKTLNNQPMHPLKVSAKSQLIKYE